MLVHKPPGGEHSGEGDGVGDVDVVVVGDCGAAFTATARARAMKVLRVFIVACVGVYDSLAGLSWGIGGRKILLLYVSSPTRPKHRAFDEFPESSKERCETTRLAG